MKQIAFSLMTAVILTSPAWSASATQKVATTPTSVKATAVLSAKTTVVVPVETDAAALAKNDAAAPAVDAAVAPAKAAVNPAFEESFGHFALGVGYPDVRMRLALGFGLAGELKLAMDGGIQVYTGKVSYNFWEMGALKVLASGELGLAGISNVNTVTASGGLAGLAIGLEYPFAKIMRVSVDAGPVWLEASNANVSFSKLDIVYNTALYIYLF